MSTFDWLRTNNRYSFRLAAKFAQREFFKFYRPKDNYVRTNKFAAITIPPSKSLEDPRRKGVLLFNRGILEIIMINETFYVTFKKICFFCITLL